MNRRSRYVSIIATTFVVLVVAGYLWHAYLRDRIFPKRFGVVEAGMLYRSGQISSGLIKKVLVEHHIKVVVDLQFDDGSAAQHAETRAIHELGIEQYRFPLNGNGTGDIKHYAAAIATIQQSITSGEPVLVHCAAGTQRTGGVIAAWQTLIQGKSVPTAIDELERYDWKPHKNRILLEYLDRNMQTLATELVDLKVLTKVPSTLPDFEHPQ